MLRGMLEMPHSVGFLVFEPLTALFATGLIHQKAHVWAPLLAS